MRAFSYCTLIRLSSILILLLAFAFDTQAQDRTASVELNNKSAIVSIFPDQFETETFDKINAAIVREPGMKWRDALEAQVTLRSDGSKSAVALGYGHHEIRFIEKKLGGILTEVHLSAAVYVPYPSLPGAEELARKFAPISVFHREEEVYPVELKDIFSNDKFAGQTLNVVADKRDDFLTNEIEVSLDNMDEFLVNNIGSFNRLNPTFHEQTCHAAFDTTICKSPHPFRTVTGDRGKAAVYWHLSQEPDRDYLTYYYFYAFDYKNGSVTNPPAAAHALDRESFTIEFDTSSGSHKPISITFGAHLESQRMLFSGYEEPEAYENTQSDWTGGR